MLHFKEPQKYKESQRSDIYNQEIVDPNDYVADVDNHENVDPNDYVAENPSPSSDLPSCSSTSKIVPATKLSLPNISLSANLAINPSSQDISATDNLGNKSSPEISAVSNLEMLTSLAAQLANASTDGSMTIQGLQFEEVDLARYTSEPAYVQPDMKPNYRDEMFHSLELVPCYEDVEMVDAATTDQEPAYVEANVNSVHSVSCGEDVEVVDAQHRKKIKGENTKKKRGKQRNNKRSDQPAKLPPLPAESELFDDPDPEPELQRRKKKSLTVLAEKMLSMFPMVEMDSVIHLDKTAESLGADLRRLYTIVDVFEALHIMSRVGINSYKWHGSNFLIQTLVWLREIAVEMGVPEQYELVKDKELDAILKSAEMKISDETRLESPLPSSEILTYTSPETPAPSSEAPAISPEYNSKYCGSTSVGINTQLFMMLMLVAPDPKTVNLEFTASVFHGSSKLKKHNPKRRFLDIANILSSLGLIQKVRITSGQGLRNAYQYTGPCVENMEVPESIKMSMPSSRQKNSLLPYPKPTENASNNVEVLENGEKRKRGGKLGSKKRVVNYRRVKKDVNKEVIVEDDKRKKNGRKPRQKNAKKVNVEIIISEIFDSIINDIFETSEKIVKKKRGRKLGSKKKVVANCLASEENVNDEVIVEDDKRKKKIGIKPGQKNAKKVEVEIIISEIFDSIINNIFETPEKIVKKKRGRKLGSKKKVVANCMASEENVNDEVIVEDDKRKKKIGIKPGQKNAKKIKVGIIITEILDSIINEIFETPEKIAKKKLGRILGSKKRVLANCMASEENVNKEVIVEDENSKKKCVRNPRQKNAKEVETETVIAEILDTVINEISETPKKIAKKKQGRKVGYRNVNNNHKTGGGLNKEANMEASGDKNRLIKLRQTEEGNKIVKKCIEKMQGKVLSERVINDEKIGEVTNRKNCKRKFDQKKEETKSKGKRVQELVQKKEEKVLSETAVNDEKIVEVNNKKFRKRKIDQNKEETIQIEAENCDTNCERKSGKKVKVGLNNNDSNEKLGIRRSSRIWEGKKRRNDLNDVLESNGGEKKVKQRRKNFQIVVKCHT